MPINLHKNRPDLIQNPAPPTQQIPPTPPVHPSPNSPKTNNKRTHPPQMPQNRIHNLEADPVNLVLGENEQDGGDVVD